MANSGAEIQVDRGEYTRIHNAILERLAEYDFTSREYACILHLLRQTYGFNRKEVKLSYGDFQNATGIDSANVSRTMKRLVEYGVVIKTDARTKAAATWSFNKYFEQWTVKSRLKTPKPVDAIYCQSDNRFTDDSIVETAIELLPKQQQSIAKVTIDDCQSDNSYISAKDNIKDNSKDKREETPPSGPTFSERNENGYFGMPVPFKREKVVADGYTQDAAKLGVTAEVYGQIFNALINIAGWRGLVDAGDNRSLTWAKEDALKLITLGHNTPEHIAKLAAAYRKAYHWKGAPTPKGLAEYASQLQAGVAPTGDKPARITAEDEAKAQADLRAAKSRIATNIKLGAKPNPRDEAIVARYQSVGAH
jgi:phage replication O-like protein O